MKVYIYTIPKAGTYFLADFIGRLGFNNTGIHVFQNEILDTAKFDMDTNSKFPSRTMVVQPFMKTLRGLQNNDLAFGHFPAPMLAWMFPDMFFVCAYRHPRQTLVSEFIDFRFRREDIKRLSPSQIPDDKAAFVAFLEGRGAEHMTIFAQMLGITLLYNEPLCKKFRRDRFHFLNFETLLKDSKGAIDLADRFMVDPERAVQAWEETKQTETKTKATKLEIDREALWSDQAEELYRQINGEAHVKRGRELGWTI
ncbi:MAG: sulfotransferase domain-containing protein [Alphaproteobacteria bacterium]